MAHVLLVAATSDARMQTRVLAHCRRMAMIRKLKSGQYRLYSVKRDEKTGRRRNLGTFATLQAAKQHERDVQYFKHR